MTVGFRPIRTLGDLHLCMLRGTQLYLLRLFVSSRTTNALGTFHEEVVDSSPDGMPRCSFVCDFSHVPMNAAARSLFLHMAFEH
jgi:hypothetical protein